MRFIPVLIAFVLVSCGRGPGTPEEVDPDRPAPVPHPGSPPTEAQPPSGWGPVTEPAIDWDRFQDEEPGDDEPDDPGSDDPGDEPVGGTDDVPPAEDEQQRMGWSTDDVPANCCGCGCGPQGCRWMTNDGSGCRATGDVVPGLCGCGHGHGVWWGRWGC